jgi:rRNA maturation endonuclease Nob1
MPQPHDPAHPYAYRWFRREREERCPKCGARIKKTDRYCQDAERSSNLNILLSTEDFAVENIFIKAELRRTLTEEEVVYLTVRVSLMAKEEAEVCQAFHRAPLRKLEA